MRRSHRPGIPARRVAITQLGRLGLAAAVIAAGAAVFIGNHSVTPAEVQGAPLASPGQPTSPGGPAAAAALSSTLPAGQRPPVAAAAESTEADPLDLDKIALTADGSHYEIVLKDGRHAQLTLDPELQSLAEKLLTEARAPRGAIVAMAPDGRILALAGRRSDPSDKKAAHAAFDWRLATDVWAPAASVFKLVTASALVSAGVDPDGKVCFHGGLRSVTESNLHDSRNDSRCESLTFGVAHSNNAILGKLAYQKLEPEALTAFARSLGVTEPIPGGELHGSDGAVDIPAVRDLNFAQAAAGFTGSRLSAVGGALLAATFADDGEQPMPRLIASIDGVAHPVPPRRRAVTAAIAEAVGKMMIATCEFGSAARSFGGHRDLRVAGKTGTLARSEPFYMEHSWFVGYAPASQPQIIVSVVLGNPESWHLRGHEAAHRLIDRALRPATGHDKDRTAKVSPTRRVGW